jgi:hypothetical protein
MSAVVRALWSRRLPLSTLIGLPFLALMLGCWPAGPAPAAVDTPRPVSIVWTAPDTAGPEIATGAITGSASAVLDAAGAARVGTTSAAPADSAPVTRPIDADPTTVHTGPIRAAAPVAVGSEYRSLPTGRAPPRR